ncbi:DUF2000 domain-containing protein [Pseudomonas sp. R2.Fl]|nr:DUF2000 domain-containing protein [Pseudomonas sp. R2.Fl]
MFRAEPTDSPDLVGIAIRPKKVVDKATKGAKLHP